MADPDGILLLDKPAGYSSTQALARAKRLLGARKAGHTGTLDPFATGLLPLAFGEATKFSRFLSDSAKTYDATLHLGRVSTTGDTEGTVSCTGRVMAKESQIAEVVASFVGFQDQIPPMHSAVHVNGRRLYELAREGIEVERKPRRVEIQAIRALSLDGPFMAISITCSKGTYIRTLAMDIGAALGCGAYLTALRRTAVGEFRLAASTTLEHLESVGVDAARQKLLPLEVMIAGLPRWEGAADDALRFVQGQRIGCPAAAPGAEFAVFEPAGRFLGVGRCEQPGELAPLRLLATGGGGQIP